MMERLFCKGCLLDVTKTHWCSCGEDVLPPSGMWKESEMPDGPDDLAIAAAIEHADC